MRAIRVRIRTLMIAVGFAAILAASAVGIIRLRRAAAYYQGQAAVQTARERECQQIAATMERAASNSFEPSLRGLVMMNHQARYHGSLARAYAAAARRPWSGAPVEPKPPALNNLPDKFADDVIAESIKRKIAWVDVARCGATDSSLALLRERPTMRSLDLSNNRFTDAGLVHLAHLDTLDLLILKGNNITDAGLAHLEGLTQLRKLDIRGTKVTPAGVARLAGALLSLEITHDPEVAGVP